MSFTDAVTVLASLFPGRWRGGSGDPSQNADGTRGHYPSARTAHGAQP
ncbi:hypothetical protein [Streptomyces sp. NPDC002990]